ncbi:glycosyltransferase family 1 protein [Capilliphycus salinus ALCB114379]|uniref:glycosyltransferase family 1 protein n=1 Tax=Capilliphycus salinus TaxID=2768948 RepID=UPI0039A514E3
MDNQIPNLQKILADLERSQSRLEQILSEQRDLSPTPLKTPTNDSGKSILFYRDFRRFSGGHLKVWDYFNHVLRSPNYTPYIYFYSAPTVWDSSNPWSKTDSSLILSQPLDHPDLIFLDGMDWQQLHPSERENSAIPILNLIQHIRHADPNNARYSFLKYKAIRICVSEEVKTHLIESGCVNGPLFVIPNHLETASFPKAIIPENKKIDLLIAALKEPSMGLELKQQLENRGKQVQLLTHPLPRREYLNQINQAKITIFLPNSREGEGFYLPALEGMALRTLVICPDCIGNRSFCLPGYNCFRPEYKIEKILSAIDRALQLSQSQVKQILSNAQQTVSEHSLFREQKAFLDILENIGQLW